MVFVQLVPTVQCTTKFTQSAPETKARPHQCQGHQIKPGSRQIQLEPQSSKIRVGDGGPQDEDGQDPLGVTECLHDSLL